MSGYFPISIFLYADDMISIAPSVEGLQKLLKVWEEEPVAIDIVAKLLGKPDDKVGRGECERVGCVRRHRYLQHLPV